MKKFTISIIMGLFLNLIIYAQTPADPPVPTTTSGDCVPTQTLTTVAPPANVKYYWQGTSCGTLVNNVALTTSVNASGTYYLRAGSNCNTANCTDWSANCSSVTVVVKAPPKDPSKPIVLSDTCIYWSIKMGNTVPANEVYYWQGATCGNSTTSSVNSFTTTLTTPIFIRAYNSTTNCWSVNCASVATGIIPPCISKPSIVSNACGSTLTKVITSPIDSANNWKYYWQGTTCGTSLTNGSNTFFAEKTGRFYIRAAKVVGTSGPSAWSLCSYVDVNVTNPIANPAVPTATTNGCGSQTLTMGGTPPGNITYFWQGNSCGTTNSFGSANTISVTATGVYYVRAYDISGCWSTSCTSVRATMNSLPNTPATFTANADTCGLWTLSYTNNPPTNANYYWQGTTCGNVTSLGSSKKINTTLTSTYYLRAMNNIGCWSALCSSVTLSTILPCISAPSVSATSCGSTLTKVEKSPIDSVSGWKYYWQGSSCGTSMTNKSNTFFTATSGKYFIRAAQQVGTSGQYNWTSCASADVNVSTPIANPLPPTTTANCYDQTLTMATPPSGVNYYWQGSSCGYSTTNSATSIVVKSNAVHYVRALDGSGCWSQSCASIYVQIVKFTTDAGSNMTITSGSNAIITATGGTSFVWSTGATTASITVNPTTKTTYTVTATSAGACTATDNVVVSIASSYVVEAGQNKSICKGDSVTLTATGGVSFKWNTGAATASIKVSPVTYTVYTVTGTDASNNTASDNVTVTVNSLPTPTVTLSGNDVVANGAIVYQWYLNSNIIPNATAQLYNPSQSGNYSVKVTDVNGCTAMSAPLYFNYVGVNYISNNNNISIYPNPAKTSFVLKTNINNGYLKIYNTQGQKLKEIKIENNITNVDINDLSIGVYVIEYNQNGYNNHYKLIKE